MADYELEEILRDITDPIQVMDEEEDDQSVTESKPRRRERSHTDSILAVDIGNVNTRAVLFDVVNGQFRFVGGAIAASTLTPPYFDASEGAQTAMEQLTIHTGRRFMSDDDSTVISPAEPNGRGVDVFVATASGGPPLRAVVAGLMPDVSLSSARRITSTVYVDIIDSYALNDRRSQAEQIQSLIKQEPDLVVLAGGTEGGANAAVMHLAETIALASYMMPDGHKPQILYVGNSLIREQINDLFDGIAPVFAATNLRPNLESELLDPGRRQLVQLYQSLRLQRVRGYGNLMRWAEGYIVPTVQALGQMLRFLSVQPRYPNGVLAVDIGSATTDVVAAYRGELTLSTYTDLGLGHSANRLLRAVEPGRMLRWFPHDISGGDFRDRLYNKYLHPQQVPDTLTALYTEEAMAREATQIALQRSRPNWPAALAAQTTSLPTFDLLVGCGAVLANAPTTALAALTLIDAVRPVGIVELAIDHYNLLTGLAVAARYSAMAAVQVLEAGDFPRLGTVIAVDGSVKNGQNAVTVRVEGKSSLEVNVVGGQIKRVPLAPGQHKITVRPHGNLDVGAGRGNSRSVTVEAGQLGLIIDARGRPLELPAKAATRHETLLAWRQALR